MIENMMIWMSRHVPRWLAYWCAIRVMVHATVGEYSDQIVSELTCADALKRWDKQIKR